MARARQRRSGRRATEASRRGTPETRPAEQASSPARTQSAPTRVASTPRGTRTARLAGRSGARAIGEASPTLEKAAAIERGYVVKDFRRIGITVAAMFVLLAIAGLLENALLS